MFKKWGNDFGHFSAFFNCGPFFACFRYGSEKQISQKIWNKIKILASIFRSLKCVFQTVHFWGPN